MDESSQPTDLLKSFKRVLTSESHEATFKVYRQLYRLGESVIPELEERLLAYQWNNIKYGIEINILSGFLSLANDLNEERARELGEKIRDRGCSEAVNARINSILDFTLDDFKIYPIIGVAIYQSRSLNDETRIKQKMTKWLSMVPNEDLKKIERLYLIPKDESAYGTYMPVLRNIMVVWNPSRYRYKIFSSLALLSIESTLYHEIGHHVHRHTFGQDPAQEDEANQYARDILRRAHPILKVIAKTIRFVLRKKKNP